MSRHHCVVPSARQRGVPESRVFGRSRAIIARFVNCQLECGLSRDFRYAPTSPLRRGVEGRITPSLTSFILSSRLREVMLATHGPSAASRLGVWSIRRPCSETPPLLRLQLLIASAPGWGARSRRIPWEPLDALENLPKETSRQVAFGELQGEVPGLSDEASARLEQPLLTWALAWLSCDSARWTLASA